MSAGRCGCYPPPLTAVTAWPGEVCALPNGHAGWHRADSGMEWGQAWTIDTPPNPGRTECCGGSPDDPHGFFGCYSWPERIVSLLLWLVIAAAFVVCVIGAATAVAE